MGCHEFSRGSIQESFNNLFLNEGFECVKYELSSQVFHIKDHNSNSNYKIAKAQVYLSQKQAVSWRLSCCRERHRKKGFGELWGNTKERDEFVNILEPYPDICILTGVSLDYERFIIPKRYKASTCPFNRWSPKYYYAPSIDRKDNNKGYEVDNIRIVSWLGNLMRGERSNEEYIATAEFIVANKGLINNLDNIEQVA